MIRLWTVLVSIAAGSAVAAAREGPAPPDGPKVTTIPLRPAVEPRPSLRYRLAAEPTGRRRANAAPFLYRALLLYNQQLGHDRAVAGSTRQGNLSVEMVDWLDLPARDFPRDRIRGLLNEMALVRREVALAVECDHADWQFDRPDNGVAFPMPEIQESRELAKLLALEGRLAILDGRLDDAFGAIRAEATLARLVADGPNLISAIIGVSISGHMLDNLRDLAAAPDAPSLFWALAERPRPFVDLRAGFESERLLLEVEVPDLRELDRGPWTVERARRCVAALGRMVEQNSPGGSGAGLNPVDVALSAARVYPGERRALIAEGRAEAEVDALPVLQVALRAARRDYLDRRDAMFRWANVPYAQSAGRLDALREAARLTRSDPLLAAMVTIHAEGLEGAKLAQARYERQFDALQIVEAIRLDANRHDGRLPSSLDGIADLPLPLDPITGRPFGYRVEGTTAIIFGPAPPGSAPSLAFEIRLVPPAPAH